MEKKVNDEIVIKNFLEAFHQNWDGSEKSKRGFIRASKEFISTIAKILGAETKKIKHIDCQTNRGEIGVFLKRGNNWVYILISDVPAFKRMGILFKRVDNPDDTRGWLNNYVQANEEGIEYMMREIKKILND